MTDTQKRMVGVYWRHPLYASWKAMVRRCTNNKCKDYPRYGGRGITVCPEWAASFWAFLDCVGERPAGMTLDRIDNNKGYEPGNVAWKSRQDQNNNMRSCKFFTFNGECLTLRA